MTSVGGAPPRDGLFRHIGSANVVDHGEPPLVVDVDGTLLRTDLLWEGLLTLAFRRPRALLGLLRVTWRGRAAMKAFVAREAGLEIATLPLAPAVSHLIGDARAANQQVVLASGAHVDQVRALAARVGADFALGSDQTNLTAHAKLDAVRDRFPTFDYVGNGAQDVPLWREARRAFAVGASAGLCRDARRGCEPMIVLEPARSPWRALVKGMRLPQWTKNLLLLLPAVAAHAAWTPTLLSRLLLGFAAFCCTASAVYLVNDLSDLASDRRHATKRHRPAASGDLPIPTALAAAAALLLVAGGIALQLPLSFGVVLLGYLLLTSAYSGWLKRRALLDVLCLASLYVIRVVAGGELSGIDLSDWFLAFFIFIFLSLALIKRVVELDRAAPPKGDVVAGRGYMAADVPVLIAIGASAGVAGALVFCLYIASPNSELVYHDPQYLWLALPLILYWQGRMWLLTARGTMREDPVLFALHDRTSYLVLLAFAVLMGLAR